MQQQHEFRFLWRHIAALKEFRVCNMYLSEGNWPDVVSFLTESLQLTPRGFLWGLSGGSFLSYGKEV